MKTHILPLLLCLCCAGNAAASIEQAKEALNNGDVDNAKQLLLKASKQPDSAQEAWLELALMAVRDDKPDDAEQYIDNAVAINADDGKVQFVLGRVMAAQAQASSIFSAPGYAKKCLKAFKRAVELTPDNPNYRDALMAYYLAAPGIMGGDNDLALAEAQAIYKLDERKGLVAKLSVYRAMEDQAKIDGLLSQITQKYPEDNVLSFHRGLFWQKQEQWQKAIDIFAAIGKRSGGEKEQQTARLQALYQLGKTAVLSKTNQQQGIDALRNYISAEINEAHLPPKEWAEFRMAMLLKQKGEKQEAKAIFSKLKSSSSDKNLLKQVKKHL